VNYARLPLCLIHYFNNVNRLLIVLNVNVVYYYFYIFCLLLNVLDRTSDIWCLVLLSMLPYIKKSLVVTSKRDQLNYELIKSSNPLMKLNSTPLKLGRKSPCFNLNGDVQFFPNAPIDVDNTLLVACHMASEANNPYF
jgi:hypothetical protein